MIKHVVADETEKPDVVLAPPGRYAAVVTGAKEGKSKGGDDMIELEWTFKVREQATQFKVRNWLVFSDAAKWKVDQFLRAIGHKTKAGETVEVVADQLVGKAAELEVDVETFKDKYNKDRQRNIVVRYLADSEETAGTAAEQDEEGTIKF